MWSKTSLEECQQSLLQISSVGQDSIARVKACFHDSELYLALVAFAADQ